MNVWRLMTWDVTSLPATKLNYKIQRKIHFLSTFLKLLSLKMKVRYPQAF